MNYQQGYPIVLGLAGGYATGKTSTADRLAPAATLRRLNDDANQRVVWDHLYFALPIYEMVSVRQRIEGAYARDRMRYEIHNILVDVFGQSPLYGAPPYRELIDMVERIVDFPMLREGKPRDFLQTVGTDICRAYDADCWVKWMKRKITREHMEYLREFRMTAEEDAEPLPHGIVISDVRFPNEAELVAGHPNGVLIRFVADPDIVKRRQKERDGNEMSNQNVEHESEMSLTLIPEEWYSAVIDTSEMTLEEQVRATRDIVAEKVGVSHNA